MVKLYKSYLECPTPGCGNLPTAQIDAKRLDNDGRVMFTAYQIIASAQHALAVKTALQHEYPRLNIVQYDNQGWLKNEQIKERQTVTPPANAPEKKDVNSPATDEELRKLQNKFGRGRRTRL